MLLLSDDDDNVHDLCVRNDSLWSIKVLLLNHFVLLVPGVRSEVTFTVTLEATFTDDLNDPSSDRHQLFTTGLEVNRENLFFKPQAILKKTSVSGVAAGWLKKVRMGTFVGWPQFRYIPLPCLWMPRSYLQRDKKKLHVHA